MGTVHEIESAPLGANFDHVALCKISDLIPYGGVAALYKSSQIALFYFPSEQAEIYAIDNYDPISRVNVLSRGIVGDVDGKRCVASPLYKQHFELASGICIEQNDIQVPTYPVVLEDRYVWLMAGQLSGA